MVQDELIFDRPPGTNGQKEFHDLFYKNITIPNGDNITLPALGELPLPISIDIDNEITNNYKIIVFIQSEDKEVIESLTFP